MSYRVQRGSSQFQMHPNRHHPYKHYYKRVGEGSTSGTRSNMNYYPSCRFDLSQEGPHEMKRSYSHKSAYRRRTQYTKQESLSPVASSNATRMPNYWDKVKKGTQESPGGDFVSNAPNWTSSKSGGFELPQEWMNVRRGRACKPERLAIEPFEPSFQKSMHTLTPERVMRDRAAPQRFAKTQNVLHEKKALFDALDACQSNSERSLLNLRSILLKTDVNALDGDGYTVLCRAVGHAKQKKNVVRVLLAAPGIDVNKLSGDCEETALYRAVGEWMDIEIVQMLLAHCGVNVNILGCLTTETPLMRAVRHNHCEVVKLLLDRIETRLDVVDENGNTAEDIARKNRRHDIVKLFVNHRESVVEYAISPRLKNVILKRHLLALKSREARIFDFFVTWGEKDEESSGNKSRKSKFRLGLREENRLLERQILAIRRKNIAEKAVGDVLIAPSDIWN